MAERKTTPENAQPPTEKEVPLKKIVGGNNAQVHKTDKSDKLLMFSLSDQDKQAPPPQKQQLTTGKETGASPAVVVKSKAGNVNTTGEAAGKEVVVASAAVGDGGKKEDKKTVPATITATPVTTLPAILTIPQVDCTMPLPSDYVQFFVNPKEQVPANTVAEPVKQTTEPHTKNTEKSKQGVRQAKEQQSKEPIPVPKPEEVQTIHSSDGIKPRIIKCRNGVPESLIKAIKEYMDKQK